MDRFWAKVDTTGECWVWTASLTAQGYGRFVIDGHETTAHRYAWTLAHGKPQDNLDVDHLCRNRRCVRVEHLRLATRIENLAGRIHHNSVKTHCKRGHELVGSNVWEPPSQPGARKCKACAKWRAQRRRASSP